MVQLPEPPAQADGVGCVHHSRHEHLDGGVGCQLSAYLTLSRRIYLTLPCQNTLTVWSDVSWVLILPKLQALVYDILPSTTAVFSYAVGSTKLSANEQFCFCFFVGAQTVVSLLQTTQITSAVCFITDHVAYASSNKTKIVWIEKKFFYSFSFFLSFEPEVDVSHVYVGAWALGYYYSHISTQTFRRALAASVDSCAEIKSVPSVT